MVVKNVYICTYKYDFAFAKICIASVRYWYPDIPIILIKDAGAGSFNTEQVEKNWNVHVFETAGKSFGWGYAKLEPLFVPGNEPFLILDADTVMTGPLLDKAQNIDAQFIVDEEVQPAKRFNEIYYNLDRINEIEKDFKYPGYSFNSGQWLGTASVVRRDDFDASLLWTNPPKPKFPDIVFNGDQAHLNFILHLKEQRRQLSVARIKLMIWPENGNAGFIDLEKIKERQPDYPFIIHWAGMKFKKITDLPRTDILLFYRRYFYTKMPAWMPVFDEIHVAYLRYHKRVTLFFKKLRNS